MTDCFRHRIFHFEEVLADLSARFVNIPSDRVDMGLKTPSAASASASGWICLRILGADHAYHYHKSYLGVFRGSKSGLAAIF